MTLSQEQVRKCDITMRELIDNILSEPFREPVDVVALGIPDYPKYVKKPMDLGTIREKLATNEYVSIREWKEDVELVWDNAIKFNMIDSPVGIMALHLRDLFRDKTKSMSGNDNSDAIGSIKTIIMDIKALFDKTPHSFELDTPAADIYEVEEPVLSPVVKKVTKKAKSSKHTASEPKISISTKNKSKDKKKSAPKVHEIIPEEPVYEPVVEEPVVVQEVAVQPEEPAPEIVEEQPPQEVEPREESYTYDSEELRIITDRVNNLTSDYDIERVAELIQTMEGSSSVEEEVEIEKLQPETIKALKQLLDSFK